MSQTLTVGQKEVIGIEVYDSISGNLLDRAVLSGQAFTSDAPSIVGASPDTDPTKDDLSALAPGTANIAGSVVADLSAYGLGSVTLAAPAAPFTVIPAPPQITPAARLVLGTPA